MTAITGNKLLSSLLFSFVLFLVFSCSSLLVHAAESDSELLPFEELELVTDNRYSITTEDGGMILFESEADYQSYLNNSKQLLCATCNQTTQTTLEKYTVSRAFIGYHPATPGWDKVKSVSIAGV